MNSRRNTRSTRVSSAASLTCLLCSTLAIGQTVTRVGVDSNGVPAATVCESPAISHDGRFVAFSAGRIGLVPDAAPDDSQREVFLHDRLTGRTTVVSVDSAGGRANDSSGTDSVCISGDGRWIGFDSSASNLVPGDTNGIDDLFVHDRLSGEVSRVNVATDGAQANGASIEISLSADGRFAAFDSTATNLVTGDTNALRDVFLRDRQTGVTTRVDLDRNGSEANDQAFDPAISGNGRFVAFASGASNLNPLGSHSTLVYRFDRETSSLVVVSLDGSDLVTGSKRPSLSSDGRFVAFFCGHLGWSVRLRDVEASTHTLVYSVYSFDFILRGQFRPRMSPDGRYVAFAAHAGISSPGFLFDREAGTLSSVGEELPNRPPTCTYPTPSRDARVVVYVGDTGLFALDSPRGDMPFVDRVRPSAGSAAGGETVRIDGSGFGTLAGTDVRFGGAPATLVDVSTARITAVAPPGSGIVDVAIATEGRSFVLPAAYRFVDREIAARFGTVNDGVGDREPVLRVTSSAGDDERVRTLAAGDRILLEMRAPSSLGSAAFVVYAWPGSPTAATLTSLPHGIGSMVFPPPFAGLGPRPRAIWNNLGRATTLGAATLPSAPAPSTLADAPAHSRHALVATFQGLVRDAASRIPEGYSVTNAVILRVE
jgi:IPT/TIG domain-containing protein